MDPVAPVRHLEPIPVEVEGQQLIVLRDPFHIIENPLTVTVPVYLLMTLMDGARSIHDIQNAFEEEYKGRIGSQELEQLIGELDENGLLLNEHFAQLRDKAIQDFRDAPVRPAVHAGAAYAGDPSALLKEIDVYYEQAGLGDGETLPDDEDTPAHGPVAAIVAPHIDPRVGGPCAVKAFAALRDADPTPDLFVIFGTAHQPAETLFSLTEKTFETPLGRVEVDTEVAQALADGCGFDIRHDEYLHKHEHSIEFQIIFLQHLLGDRPFRILPILVGSFQPFVEANELPSASPVMQHFCASLRQAVADSGRRVCYVAGADLSHRGRKFGDDRDASEEFVDETKWADAKMLAHVQEGRREEFFHHLQTDGDEQKVCGLPPIYTMMLTMGDGHVGRLVSYDVNIEKPTESFVSYAGLVFYEKA